MKALKHVIFVQDHKHNVFVQHGSKVMCFDWPAINILCQSKYSWHDAYALHLVGLILLTLQKFTAYNHRKKIVR